MAQPWKTIERSVNGHDVLELRRRGERDFLLLVNGRVLMNSSANRSEIALGEQACRMVAGRLRPRVLIGGLGMGFTLRAALDVLPPSGQVIVAELSPAVVDWCRGPLAGLAYDMMYGRGSTPFLAFARAPGAGRCADGLGMLVEQAAESFFVWRGVRPDTAPVIGMLRHEA